MKKIIIAFILSILLVIFSYYYLAIELELKYSIEHHGVKINQLIDSSARLRMYAQIQIVIFVLIFIINLFLLNKVFKRNV